MTTFIEKISSGFAYDTKQVLGYSEEELDKISKLYGISISGDFRMFLLEMGRCDGGLIGDDPIILYRDSWTVRGQILHQVTFFSDMQESGHFEFLSGQPFTFSCESETQHYFIRTSSDKPDRVYHYDENNEVVNETGLSFLEYMKETVKVWGGKGIVCRGELLIV